MTWCLIFQLLLARYAKGGLTSLVLWEKRVNLSIYNFPMNPPLSWFTVENHCFQMLIQNCDCCHFYTKCYNCHTVHGVNCDRNRSKTLLSEFISIILFFFSNNMIPSISSIAPLIHFYAESKYNFDWSHLWHIVLKHFYEKIISMIFFIFNNIIASILSIASSMMFCVTLVVSFCCAVNNFLKEGLQSPLFESSPLKSTFTTRSIFLCRTQRRYFILQFAHLNQRI